MRKIVLAAVLAISSITVFGQQRNAWAPVNETTVNRDLFASRSRPANYKLFQLNESIFKTTLASAPSERFVNSGASTFILTIPGNNGQLQQFRVVEAPVMHPDLAARYPDIQSFAGKGVDDPSTTIRFDISPQGFHGMIMSPRHPTVYIDPVDKNHDYYILVSRSDVMDYRTAFQCLTTATSANESSRGESAERNANDGLLRTYRLALCATGEFSQYWLDGTETSDAQRKAKVLAAQNTAMTRANGIFEKDFGLRLVLVANNDAVIYLTPSTDPWTSNNLNSATQTTCDNVIGSANYDIGHLVHRASDNGNAGCIGCVCRAGSKGSGFTSYLNLTSDYFVVDYLTHEMGHQLGANHTFTFSNEGTIAQVEPGSGSTIMGYAGITGSTDVQPHSDDYFHAISIQQVTNYIKSASGGCSFNTVTGNSTPTANAGADYTIPRSTPFTLTGTGTDADGADVLTYCWEQNDPRATGFSTFPSATATAGPQFRSYLPVTTPSRTVPVLSSILSGSNSNQWEVLPSVSRTLHFRFTVRDNHAGGGNNNSDDMTLVISGTTGPFAVTAPNTAVTWGIGTSQNVTWSVNGTTGTPVNCAAVNILLSTDGGQTFPIVLASNTPNDGSEAIVVPNNAGNTNRVKVEAVGNIFFDISNTNFTIGSAPACADPSGLSTTSITTSSATLNWSAVSGANSYDVDYKASASSTWINVTTGTGSTSTNLAGLSASTSYDWRIRANCSSASSNYSSASFTTTASGGACPGPYDVSSNGTIAGAAPIPLNTDIRGTISPRGDNDYYAFTITTGGTITLSLTTLPANYQLGLYNGSGTLVGSSANNGSANETINATVASGTYYARVYPKGNAQNAGSCYTLRVQTGTASRNAKDLITMGTNLIAFPNPAGPTLEVRMDGLVKRAEMQVIDMSGRVVMRNVLLSNTKQLDVSRLSPGVYLLSVSENGITSRVRFVKD